MRKPTACVIHEAIGNSSSIAKIAMTGIRTILDAGWQVSVVAKILDESLQGKVEWLRLTVPPRLFFVKWVTARTFIRQAMGGRQFDVVHTHQPQVASVSDMLQCQFLTRVALERKCLESRSGLGPGLVRAQQLGALRLEDYFFRHWNPNTRLVFCSELLRKEFHRLYGTPPREDVMVNACPPPNPVSREEQREARKKLIGYDPEGTVVGYLGGINERKGYRQLIDGLTGHKDLFFLLGGQFTDDFQIPAMAGHYKATGLVHDPTAFYAACDIVAVPSYFDPCPLVVFEASARGRPVIATDGVGNLPNLLEYGAGAAWEFTSPLAPLVRSIMERLDDFQRGAERMVEALSAAHQAEQLLKLYAAILEEKHAKIKI